MKKIRFVNSKDFSAEKHGFHLVKPSPWPFLTSVGLLDIALYTVLIFDNREVSYLLYLFLWLYFFMIIGMWFRDVIIESHQGMHTSKVQRGFRYGMIVILISETMFFFGFFWCFFYMSISPSIWIGSRWPPLGIQPINPLHLPLLNTILLVSSGVSAFFVHKSIMCKDGRQAVTRGLMFTAFLGILFTLCQIYEYCTAPFSINDGIYGSIFYVSTGFHGLHVIIGTIAIIVCLIRHLRHHFQRDHHVGLELSFWYWHFVDVIWILLYLTIYWMSCDINEVLFGIKSDQNETYHS